MKHTRNRFRIAYYVLYAIVIALFGAGACASAQKASTTKVFEVATIKPAAPFDPRKFGPRINQARATYTDLSLKNLIAYAYDVKEPQVSGPEWIASEKYDIVATLPKGAAKEDDKRMLQALLKERFKLAFHIEKRELEVYALVVDKHGAKLKPSPPDSPESEADKPLKPGESYVGEGDRKVKQVKNKDGSSTINMGKSGTQTTKFDWESKTMHWERSKITMEEFAKELTSSMDAFKLGGRMVVDQTGIKGNYQVAIDIPLGISMPNRLAASGDASDTIPSDPQGGGALNKSLDAMGLKLEKRKVPIDVYVIVHVEKPSAN